MPLQVVSDHLPVLYHPRQVTDQLFRPFCNGYATMQIKDVRRSVRRRTPTYTKAVDASEATRQSAFGRVPRVTHPADASILVASGELEASAFRGESLGGSFQTKWNGRTIVQARP